MVDLQREAYSGAVKWAEVGRQMGSRTDAACKNAYECERGGGGVGWGIGRKRGWWVRSWTV